MSVPPPGLTSRDLQLRQWLLDQAEEHGAAVVQVAGENAEPPYAFTVGAWRRFGLAEGVAVGLPEEISQVLLLAYVNRARHGERFQPGSMHEGFFEGLPVAFEKVDAGWYPEYLGSAFLCYPTGHFPALQLIVPTPEGFWPWTEDAPAGFAHWQPILTASGELESFVE